MNNKLITEALVSYQFALKGCSKLMCTTCGGFLDDLKNNPHPELDHKLNEYVANSTFNDFVKLDKQWQELIIVLKPRKINRLFFDKVKNIDFLGIRELDFILIKGRIHFSNYEPYKKCLRLGIAKAIEYQDESLIETIIIILGKDTWKYQAFLSIALELLHKNDLIHKALYNSVRNSIPEVRSYMGNGCSIVPWV